MSEVTNKTFLLIQGGIIASDNDPYCLIRKAAPLYDIFAGFKVAVGCVNEFGAREVIGVVADVQPLRGARTWFITSKQDGYNRHVGSTGSPDVLVANRLTVMLDDGDFDDLVNLPAPVQIQPGTALVAIDSESRAK